MRLGCCLGRRTVAWSAEAVGPGQENSSCQGIPPSPAYPALLRIAGGVSGKYVTVLVSVRLLVFTGFAFSPSLATLHGAMFS